MALQAWVKEFENLKEGQSYPMQVWNEPAAVEQGPLDFTSGHIESTAFGANTKYIAISVNAPASYLVSSGGTAATTNNFRLPVDTILVVGVKPTQKISFISNP